MTGGKELLIGDEEMTDHSEKYNAVKKLGCDEMLNDIAKILTGTQPMTDSVNPRRNVDAFAYTVNFGNNPCLEIPAPGEPESHQIDIVMSESDKKKLTDCLVRDLPVSSPPAAEKGFVSRYTKTGKDFHFLGDDGDDKRGYSIDMDSIENDLIREGYRTGSAPLYNSHMESGKSCVICDHLETPCGEARADTPDDDTFEGFLASLDKDQKNQDKNLDRDSMPETTPHRPYFSSLIEGESFEYAGKQFKKISKRYAECVMTVESDSGPITRKEEWLFRRNDIVTQEVMFFPYKEQIDKDYSDKDDLMVSVKELINGEGK